MCERVERQAGGYYMITTCIRGKGPKAMFKSWGRLALWNVWEA